MHSSNRSGSSHHHRFIPSEEVQDVVAWEFAPVGEGAIEHRQPNRAGKANEPEVPEAEQLEALRQQARAEGFEQGRLAGAKETRDALEAQMKRQTQELAQRVTQVVQKAQQDFAQLEQTLASQLLELACDLARQVVRRELHTPLDPLRAVVNEALALAVEDGQASTLKLHPTDWALLQADMAETLSAMKVHLVADDQLTPGGCVVENASGGVDARLEKRWARAVANLGLEAPWQPGEEADV
jgi:flagellar assembly protein FliH